MIEDNNEDIYCRENCVRIIGAPQISIDKKNDKIIMSIYAHLSREISLEDLGHVYIIIRIFENKRLIHEETIEPVPGTDYIGEDIELEKRVDPKEVFVELMIINK